MEQKFSSNAILKDTASNYLLEAIKEFSNEMDFGSTTVYYKYPFYKNHNKDVEVRADFLFVSQNKNIHIFSCHNALRQGDVPMIKNKLEELFGIIDSKLRNKNFLKKNRTNLKFDIQTHVFCNNTDLQDLDPNILLFHSKDELREFFQEVEEKPLTYTEYKLCTSVIEGMDETIVPQSRTVTHEDSRGSILTKIESSIINYDTEQFKAVVTKVDGFQRIRGLAGTGKTIILARKVAELHRDEPDKKILYTYYTKALNEIVVKHIDRYYKTFSGGKAPNWEKIDVIHSWGGSRLAGVYYKMCRINGVEPIDFRTAKVKSPKFPFEYVCKDLLENMPLKKYYDYVVIDEGQDFKENFYRLCLNVVKNNNVIWAYDDFQDILKTDLQDEKMLFGKDEAGNFYADFQSMENPEDHDIILKKCYRNSRQILTSAFSLGMGVYNKTDKNKIGEKCLQRIESNKAWEDIGFSVLEGNSVEGELMRISRPISNSPDYKEHLLAGNLIDIKVCDNISEECKYVRERIVADINEDLRPEDICVICLDNIGINDYYGTLVQLLEQVGIKTFNLQNSLSTNIRFTRSDSVTLSSIYRAKGNECGSIYIMGADAIFRNADDVYERNKIFTAITRSKGWVCITGTGEITNKCQEELDLLAESEFHFNFYQPSGEFVKTIKERSIKESKKKKVLTQSIQELAEEHGMSVEDYIKNFLLKG